MSDTNHQSPVIICSCRRGASLQIPMPPPAAIQGGGSVHQNLSAAYDTIAFCKHRRAADKRYLLGFTGDTKWRSNGNTSPTESTGKNCRLCKAQLRLVIKMRSIFGRSFLTACSLASYTKTQSSLQLEEHWLMAATARIDLPPKPVPINLLEVQGLQSYLMVS